MPPTRPSTRAAAAATSTAGSTGWPVPSLPQHIHQHWAYEGKGEERTKELYFYNSQTKETSTSAFAWLGCGVGTGGNDGVTSDTNKAPEPTKRRNKRIDRLQKTATQSELIAPPSQKATVDEDGVLVAAAPEPVPDAFKPAARNQTFDPLKLKRFDKSDVKGLETMMKEVKPKPLALVRPGGRRLNHEELKKWCIEQQEERHKLEGTKRLDSDCFQAKRSELASERKGHSAYMYKYQAGKKRDPDEDDGKQFDVFFIALSHVVQSFHMLTLCRLILLYCAHCIVVPSIII